MGPGTPRDSRILIKPNTHILEVQRQGAASVGALQELPSVLAPSHMPPASAGQELGFVLGSSLPLISSEAPGQPPGHLGVCEPHRTSLLPRAATCPPGHLGHMVGSEQGPTLQPGRLGSGGQAQGPVVAWPPTGPLYPQRSLVPAPDPYKHCSLLCCGRALTHPPAFSPRSRISHGIIHTVWKPACLCSPAASVPCWGLWSEPDLGMLPASVLCFWASP